jgi:hypothetical protein
VFPPWKSHRKETGAQGKPRSGLGIKKIAIQAARCTLLRSMASGKFRTLLRRVDGQRLRAARHVEKRIKVVKCSSVSTGQLKRLLALHNQPINLVVFQGTLGPKSNET